MYNDYSRTLTAKRRSATRKGQRRMREHLGCEVQSQLSRDAAPAAAPLYNLSFTVVFSVQSPSQQGEGITPAMLSAGLRKRADDLDRSAGGEAWIKAAGQPFAIFPADGSHCTECGRPEADCSADPCWSVIADREA